MGVANKLRSKSASFIISLLNIIWNECCYGFSVICKKETASERGGIYGI